MILNIIFSVVFFWVSCHALERFSLYTIDVPCVCVDWDVHCIGLVCLE